MWRVGKEGVGSVARLWQFVVDTYVSGQVTFACVFIVEPSRNIYKSSHPKYLTRVLLASLRRSLLSFFYSKKKKKKSFKTSCSLPTYNAITSHQVLGTSP